jgi:hypothetical protein
MKLSKILCCGTSRPASDVDKENVRLEGPTANDRLFGLWLLPNPQVDKLSVAAESPTTIDVVFVHGLGGSARQTWTHGASKQFWPLWLYRLDAFQNVRLFTFGYDAEWQTFGGPRNALDIRGFAHQLLDDLSLHYRRDGDVYLS